MSSCKSASIETIMSASFTAVSRPASSAFWWPRLRERFTPENISGSFSCSSLMIAHVLSLEPSLTNITRLRRLILPSSINCRIFSRRRLLVSGSTSCSL